MKIENVLIGQRVRSARLLRNMTAHELSEKIGLSEVTLRHIETGANKTSLQTLVKIADVLEVSTDYLLGRVSSPYESVSVKFKEAHDLTETQEKMLHDLVKSMLPVITGYVEK